MGRKMTMTTRMKPGHFTGIVAHATLTIIVADLGEYIVARAAVCVSEGGDQRSDRVR